MGLLDDAIREHLDLKRRRGADPAEVERAEREALGPVRRAPTGAGEPDAELGPANGQEPGYDAHEQLEPVSEVADQAEWHDPFAAEIGPDHETPAPFVPDPAAAEPPATAAHETLAAEPPLAPAPAAAPEPLAPVPPPAVASEPPTPTPVPVPVEEPERPPLPPPSLSDHVGDETVEYDVEDALQSEPEPEGEDVLEETPEFLQDTPDHDRLWFEQKPPRDFDFDG